MNKLIIISFFLMKYFFLIVTLFLYGVFLNEYPPNSVDTAYPPTIRDIIILAIFIVPISGFYFFHKLHKKYKNFI